MLAGAAGFGPVDDIALGLKTREDENADTLGNADERSADDIDVLPSGVVVIGNKNNVCTAKKLSVFGLPLLRAAAIAGGRNTPRPKQIGLALAFDNENRMIGGNRLRSTAAAGKAQPGRPRHSTATRPDAQDRAGAV